MKLLTKLNDRSGTIEQVEYQIPPLIGDSLCYEGKYYEIVGRKHAMSGSVIIYANHSESDRASIYLQY